MPNWTKRRVRDPMRPEARTKAVKAQRTMLASTKRTRKMTARFAGGWESLGGRSGWGEREPDLEGCFRRREGIMY
jgi:hypothetical protein